MSLFKTISSLLLVAVLTACGGGGGDGSKPTASTTTTTTSTTSAVASILLTAPSPATLNADASSSLTFTVRALDSSSALVKGATIALTTTSNTILSASSVVTDATTGLATVSLTANSSDQVTRVATVTASCSSCLAAASSVPVQVNGATLTVASSGGSALTAGGNTITLSATVKDASGAVLAGVPVTFASTDALVLGLSSLSGSTNTSGVVSTVVSGLTAGSASVNVSVLGNAKALAFTVTAPVGTLVITSPANNSVMVTNLAQTISVSAPGAGKINFSSTLGTFSLASVNASSGSSDLTSTQAGSATVTVFDDQNRTASIVLKVSPPVSAANKVILSASRSTVGLATSTNVPTLRLTARALYSVGSSDQGVANVPILFSMVGGPGAGEYLTPAYQLTDGSGFAYADFYAGNSASNQNGISVSAKIQGTAIQTGTPPSSNSALLTVGGQALSVAFGAASVLRESIDKTLYIQDYSVQVTDANNNPVPNAVVTLRVRPVAFSLGGGCTITKDAFVPTANATYCSEDANGNGSLDAGEDGVRILTSPSTAGQCAIGTPIAAGTSDTLLTPQNSVAGSVPSTVTTSDGNLLTPDGTAKMPSGTAQFSLTYLKASAIWVVDQLSATVSVNGTESGASTIFQLAPSEVDVKLPDICHIPNSPFAR